MEGSRFSFWPLGRRLEVEVEVAAAVEAGGGRRSTRSDVGVSCGEGGAMLGLLVGEDMAVDLI